MKDQYPFIRTVCKCTLASIIAGFAAAIFLMCVVMILSSVARAGSAVEDVGSFATPYEAKRGTLMFYGKNSLAGAPVLDMDAKMKISGMIARVHVRQEFKNPDKQWKEGIYVFPLPENAAVDHMRMYIGKRVIEGQVKERLEAKKIYNQAKNNGRKTSLVEQERPNIFTTSVANIGPLETVTVEIEYQQIVKYDQGKFSLRFPLVAGPRYIPGHVQVKGFDGSGWAGNTDQVEDAARITPPVKIPGEGKINPVSISIDLDPGIRLERIDSPYHAVKLRKYSGSHYKVELASGPIPADRDFVLDWMPTPGAGPRAALFKETLNENEYALIMLLPPAGKTGKIINREVIFVIDTSGSMGGASIRQAKAAMNLALYRLKDGDRFNIIQFNSYTTQLFPGPQPVSQATIQTAEYYVQSLQAGGGTEMAPAIRAALKDQPETSLVRQIVFLTDGSVGNEDELFHIIENNLGDGRLFTVGIGSAPNSHFMARAASFGRGTHTYIGKIDEVQEKMTELFKKIESPVMTDLTLEWPKHVAAENWPQNIPDLYLGEPLLVTVKSQSLPDRLTVKGKIADRNWKSDISLNGGRKESGINVLWARRKIATLMDQKPGMGEKDSIKDEILRTALEHHLVSKYTSLVAVDVTPSRDTEIPLQQRPVPTNLPAGWEYDKVFGRIPSTATPAELYFMLGLLLLSLASIIYIFKSAAVPLSVSDK